MGKNKEEKREMKINRKPMHVDIEFERRMKLLQKKIMMKQGIKPSLRELTAQLPKFEEFEVIEKRLIGNVDKMMFEIKFNKRKK